MHSLTKPIPIRFRNHTGEVVQDEIRSFFNHVELLEPYAPNRVVPGAVLTEHSWIPVSDILEFVG